MHFHGLFLIHKKEGETSHDVVSQVRRLLKTKEVGHAGTLDPLASGLMLLLVGEGTKLSQYLLEKEKSYRLRAVLGYETDTLDRTGLVTSENRTKAACLALEEIQQAILSLHGDLNLPIPLYSAKKIDGKKLYEYARENKPVEQPSKIMSFWGLTIHSLSGQQIEVSLSCSKGSFVRSWVSELGRRLGCGATMDALERTGSRPFHLESAITIEGLQDWLQKRQADSVSSFAPAETSYSFYIPLGRALQGVKRVLVEGKDERLIRDGLIGHQLRSFLISKFQPGEDEIVQIFSKSNENLLALIGLDPEKGFRIRRVFSSERII